MKTYLGVDKVLNLGPQTDKTAKPYLTGKNVAVKVTFIALIIVVGLALLYSVFFTWPQVVLAMALSQRKRVVRAANNIEELRMDGFMQQLKTEVTLLAEDAF
ncbi:kinase d-interacting substrate of 220 kda [Plakobranchus ocellatus]|uniref:Kinase d-interacting substrate of 220 kDa n=1 Tax=Plakobranchus ocellatus TaxID=259542 RepID=A0AAV4DG90_9GAST|nr:kinase d-interacting substrate of 220 kda [Plakobranchus ocellatus]